MQNQGDNIGMYLYLIICEFLEGYIFSNNIVYL